MPKSVPCERTRVVTRVVPLAGEVASALRAEQIIDYLRREVQRAREDVPDLEEYHLYDLKITLTSGTVVHLDMEFKR